MRTFIPVALAAGAVAAQAGQPVHVWETVEIPFEAAGNYANPYAEVEVWVDLSGPGFEKRCYGFWDGGKNFRVRVLAPSPGTWRWRSGSTPEDRGLAGKEGQFEALPWTDAELAENDCRRGMVRASANGHAFEWSDGTPFFLIGDTWWSIPTFRFPWRDDDVPYPLGREAGFKDYVAYRRKQGFNCLAMIAAFPHWHNDGKPARLDAPDGTVIRAAWPQVGTHSAQTMTDEQGNRPFLFPGKVPGFEEVVPDLERINPAYFQSLDRKIDYLNSQGMVPFIEVARRDIGQVWRKYYPWPDSYTRYIQYVWSRYQANLCLFSPIHFDTPAKSIPAAEWNRAANLVIERYGAPPFGTPCGTNANPSSLVNWGHTDRAKWLTFHQIGNRRTHDCYRHLTDIFHAEPPVPGLNGEPYYDGMEDAEPGSDLAALYCRSAMYGSVLSGGLGGHIYGAGGWKVGQRALWSGEVEAGSKCPVWEAIKWPSAAAMGHLKTFMLSEGARYRDLQPATDLLTPNRSGKPDGLTGWAYCAATKERDLLLLYFERGCPAARLSGLPAGADLVGNWFDPRTGEWIGERDHALALAADDQGVAALPAFPQSAGRAKNDWALKLKRVNGSPRHSR